MPSVLLSGPAGANKTSLAREIIAENPGLMVASDFQAIYAALTLVLKDQITGRYPLRNEALLPLVEYVRRAAITGAVSREIDVVLTNSDGNPERRAFLLGLLGEGATERVVDPGRVIVEARLSDPHTGELSDACVAAISRWYV